MPAQRAFVVQGKIKKILKTLVLGLVENKHSEDRKAA